MSWLRLNRTPTPAAAAVDKAMIYYSSTFNPRALAAIDESGNVMRLGGFTTKDYRLIRVRQHVAADGTTYTPTVGIQALYVECIGGGGAGGGGATAAVSASLGAGGGAGAYSAVWLTGAQIKSSYTVAVGAGGTPGAAGNNPGGNGGDTTFDVASVCTAKGGTGGPGGGAAGTTALFVVGAQGGLASAGVGDLKIDGIDGGASQRVSGTVGCSGRGGDGPIGGGSGTNSIAQGTGAAGTTFGGAGGGGATLSGGAATAGGAGFAGLIRIWEFA